MLKVEKKCFYQNWFDISTTFMGFEMESESVSSEENNLLRLIYVIKKPCTECLRHVLQINVPSYTDVKHAVSSNQIKLQKRLKKEQQSKLFPNSMIRPDFDVYQCDMSLLYTIIRNVSSVNPPTTGWGNPVNNQPREVSIGANVERLRTLRNDIIHDDRHEITDSDFDNFWTDIEESLADIDKSLGNTNFKQNLLRLRRVSLEKNFIQKEITNIRTRKELHEIKGTLEELSNTMTNIGQQVSRNAEVQNKQNVRLEQIHERVCRSTGQCEVGTDPIDVAGCTGIQRLSIDGLENTEIINHQSTNNRECAGANCEDSVNIPNLHNEADNNGVPDDAVNFDMSRDNDISIAEGPDGFICLMKQFRYIKSNLLKKDAVNIAEQLLKDECITEDEHETLAGLERKPCIDILLKKIILGEDKDQLKTFFRALRSVNKNVFRVTEATEVTDEDRSRLKQLEERALQVTNTRSRSVTKTFLDESDIHFFKNRLSSSKEVVDRINDTMLARFNFSVREHSNILECTDSDPKIQKLCETMNLCDMDVEKELKALLRDSLYEKWMAFRRQKENQDRPNYLRWLNALVSPVQFIFPTLRFNTAVNGCIILKFSTGDSFDIASLTREFVRENIADLLWKGNLETQVNIKNPVHVTVFIMSPSKTGNDEIHFYLDFDAADERTRGEDCGLEIENHERLLEQLDLIELTEWIMNQPDIGKTATKMLEDKLSCSDMSRKEELHVLLDSIFQLENGRDLIETFCKENYQDVYNNLFLRIKQDSSEKNTSLVQNPLHYERGRGLQRLYSFRINNNTDQKETEGLQRATLDKKPSKELPNPEVSDIKMSQVTEGLHRATLGKRPSNELPNPEVSDSSIIFGHTYNPIPTIQKTCDDPVEPKARKIDGIAYVIQVGKLEDVWSDVMFIFGEDRYSLPRTFIEKVGPQIQREFQEKYPKGLSDSVVAVLNGFNIPVWKIFYCSFDNIEECFYMAGKTNMRSILVLIQEETVAVHTNYAFCRINLLPFDSISTIYLYVDQDTKEWRKLREIAEGIMPVYSRQGYFTEYLSDDKTLSAGPKPKVFKEGQTTVVIQFGKLEEIQSDAVIIFEAATAQWPIQNLPSEMLEKAGPMIQREFKEKFPIGLEYAEVAVLNGHNLPFSKILYGVLPRWPGAWLEQVIAQFLTECVQLTHDEGIKSITYLIPSVTYHIAELYASVLHGIQIYDEPSLIISTEKIVIKDGCTGANMLKKVFEDEWASKRVFKEGHVTIMNGEKLLRKILMRRGKVTRTSVQLSEGAQEKAVVPDSKALVIVSDIENFTKVLEKIDPSLKAEFRTKYPSVPYDEVAILDGNDNPFRKVYWKMYTSEVEITDIILECFQMAVNEKINSILLKIYHNWVFEENVVDFLILCLRIFAIENPISTIRKLYNDIHFFRKEERHLTVALSGTYDEYIYRHNSHVPSYQGLEHKLKSVHVICDATGEWQTSEFLYGYQQHLKQSQPLRTKDKIMMHSIKGFTSGEVLVLEHYSCKTIRAIIPTHKLRREDMDMFLFKCIQEADDNGLLSVNLLVPKTVRSIKLFASSIISVVKRFAKDTPSSNIKRIYIRMDNDIAGKSHVKQTFEDEWSRTSGEESLDYFSHLIDELQEENRAAVWLSEERTDCASKCNPYPQILCANSFLVENQSKVFKEGHMPIVNEERLLEKILHQRRRGKATQTSVKLSEGAQEKAIVPDLKALVIISDIEDFTNVLEEIDPSLKAEFRTKYPSVPYDEVTILDGYNNPFMKIYWKKYTLEVEITDIIFDCFQMAENDKINSILLKIYPHWAFEEVDVEFEVILGVRIFAIENPLSGIRRLYNDIQFFRKEIVDVTPVKVFKERYVTVALCAQYDERVYHKEFLVPSHQGPEHKLKSVHVICNATGEWQTRRHFYEYEGHLKQNQPLRTEEKGMMQLVKFFTSGEVLVLEHYSCNTIRVIIPTHSLNRQDMDMFFYKCIQEADGYQVSSVTFFVPETDLWNIKSLASTIISCVKRFAKVTPSSSIKRIYIRINKHIARWTDAKQIFEEEWTKTSGENPDYMSRQIDEPQEKHLGKQYYPTEDFYLKKKLSISELPEKSKETSEHLSQEDVK